MKRPAPAQPAIGGPPPHAVRVDNLSVAVPHPRSRYRAATPVLDEVSFTAPRGHVTALVGTNGAGKTTLLRTLTGALRPSSGSIDVLGSPVGPPEDACPPGVAVVPDAPVLPEEWTAREVIALHRRLGDPFDPRGFTAMLRARGIGRRTMIGSLSAGQSTHFSLAHALAKDPQLLVLDEPLARLDPLARTELIDRLRERIAADDSRSVLLSTHDLDGMDRFVDRLVVLHEGRTVLEGDVHELLEGHLVATCRGEAETLIGVDDAVGLPPGTALREPGLAELVSVTLASVSGRTDPEDRS